MVLLIALTEFGKLFSVRGPTLAKKFQKEHLPVLRDASGKGCKYLGVWS